MKKISLISAVIAATAMPMSASANCAKMSGSFLVTCEKGVQVYRHNSMSLRTVGLSDKYAAQVETAEIRAKSQRDRLAAQADMTRARTKLREQALRNQRYFYRRATISSPYSGGSRIYSRASRYPVVYRRY
jgi:hypothetical protein